MPEDRVNNEVLNELMENAEEEKIQFSFKRNDNYQQIITDVENKRQDIHVKFKKSKRLSNIVTLIAIALIIGAFILIVQPEPLKYVGYGVGGAALVGMLVFYFLNKSKFPSATKDYIKDITELMNSYAFHDERLDKLYLDPNEKIDQYAVTGDRVYKNVSRTGSRGVVHGKYEGENFTVGELAAYIRTDKRQEEPLFVGKYLSTYNNYQFDGRVLIQLKSKTKVIDSPNDLDDLVNAKEDDDMVIYASKNIDYKDVADSLFLSKLRRISVENHLINLNLVIWGGHTAVYMSFDDATMVLPFENQFDGTALKQYQEVLMQAFELVSSLFTKKVIASKPASEIKEEAEKEEKNQEETPEVKEEKPASEEGDK